LIELFADAVMPINTSDSAGSLILWMSEWNWNHQLMYRKPTFQEAENTAYVTFNYLQHLLNVKPFTLYVKCTAEHFLPHGLRWLLSANSFTQTATKCTVTVQS